MCVCVLRGRGLKIFIIKFFEGLLLRFFFALLPLGKFGSDANFKFYCLAFILIDWLYI